MSKMTKKIKSAKHVSKFKSILNDLCVRRLSIYFKINNEELSLLSATTEIVSIQKYINLALLEYFVLLYSIKGLLKTLKLV
ncbi:hypothetical protein J18TS1_42280 [Oceanobacillus oncorhynchi subsp. incaldanensis]|nr:hypothetical protein J18TS1_42280 [Oceanobacillus oncorhynchi subsp. incaldanensis]